MIIDYRTNVLLSRDIATGKEEIGEKGNRENCFLKDSIRQF
jgi:hypothetical protein